MGMHQSHLRKPCDACMDPSFRTPNASVACLSQAVITELIKKNPNYKPPSDYRPEKKYRRLRIPQDEHPQYNFIGLIIGPRCVVVAARGGARLKCGGCGYREGWEHHHWMHMQTQLPIPCTTPSMCTQREHPEAHGAGVGHQDCHPRQGQRQGGPPEGGGQARAWGG